MSAPNAAEAVVPKAEIKSDPNGHPNQPPERHNNFGNQRRGGPPNRFQGGNRRFGGHGGPGGNPNFKKFVKNDNFNPRKRGPPIRMGEGVGMNEQQPQERPGPVGPIRPQVDKFQDRLMQMGGHTYELPSFPICEKKFSGKNRLYIGNIGNEVTEEEITDLFKPYGETSEIFINKEKNFAFIKLDFHSNAAKAKRELDGTVLKGRNLKIRFAPNSASVKVRNLSPFVSNELLQYAFSIFGEVERATILVDERGRPTGSGVVDFTRKGSALNAIRKCTDGCFFLTSSLRPCIVESHDIVDDADGFPEKSIIKKGQDFHREREVGPRFANPDSFEHEYGMRWKQLHTLYHQKEEALKKEFEMEKEKLEAQMEFAKYEQETEMLREQLRAREMDRERQKREWELKERQVEEQRVRNEEQMRRQQEEMENRLMHQEEEMRRRQQENNLFMQANNLNNMLEQQEQAYDGGNNYNGPNNEGVIMDPKSFMSSYERNNHRFDGRENVGLGPRGGGNMGGRGHWANDRRDDFQNKRRRF